MEKAQLKKMFQQANKVKANRPKEEEALDADEFLTFYYSLLRRPELDRIFLEYVSDKVSKSAKMTAADLARFLLLEQKCEVPVEECQKFIEAFEPTSDRDQSLLSMEGFTQFMMFSEWQNIVDVAGSRTVYQDM